MTPLVGAPTAFAAASLIARVGTRRLIAAGSVTLASAILVLALTDTPATPWIAVSLAGLGTGMVDMGILTAATRHEAAGHPSIVGRVQAFFFVGLVLGGATGTGVLAVGLPYRVALGIVATGLLVTGLLVARGTIDYAARDGDGRPRIRRSLAIAGVPVLVALCFGGFFLEGATTSWTGVYLREELGAAAAVASASVLGVQIGLAVGAAGTDVVLRHVSPRTTLTVGATVAAVGVGIASLAGTPVVAALAILVAAIGFGGIGPAAFTLTGRVDAAHGGGVLATVTALAYLAFLIGPFGMGQIGEVAGLRAAFGVAAAMAVAVGLVAAFARLPEPAARVP